MTPEKMDIGVPKQKTPEEIKEISKNRKRYGKNAAKLARRKTSITERLLGTGISKNEVIRADAELENETGWGKEKLKDLQNSSLEIKRFDKTLEDHIDGYAREYILSGEIKGKKIEIHVHFTAPTGFTKRRYIEKVEGYIDGARIIEKDAKKIFDRYREIADLRDEKIEEIKKEKKENKENKKNDMTRKRTSEDVSTVLSKK